MVTISSSLCGTATCEVEVIIINYEIITSNYLTFFDMTSNVRKRPTFLFKFADFEYSLSLKKQYSPFTVIKDVIVVWKLRSFGDPVYLTVTVKQGHTSGYGEATATLAGYDPTAYIYSSEGTITW